MVLHAAAWFCRFVVRLSPAHTTATTARLCTYTTAQVLVHHSRFTACLRTPLLRRHACYATTSAHACHLHHHAPRFCTCVSRPASHRLRFCRLRSPLFAPCLFTGSTPLLSLCTHRLVLVLPCSSTPLYRYHTGSCALTPACLHSPQSCTTAFSLGSGSGFCLFCFVHCHAGSARFTMPAHSHHLHSSPLPAAATRILLILFPASFATVLVAQHCGFACCGWLLLLDHANASPAFLVFNLNRAAAPPRLRTQVLCVPPYTRAAARLRWFACLRRHTDLPTITVRITAVSCI